MSTATRIVTEDEKVSNTALECFSLPQVLHLPDRGDCAIDYIDLFDESRHGADQLYWRGRYTNLEDVAQQIKATLAMGNPIERPTNSSSIIEDSDGNENTGSYKLTFVADDEESSDTVTLHNALAFNRWNAEKHDKTYPAIKHPYDAWPNKARFPLNILLRIKFYGDFAYINLGDFWGSMFDESALNCPKDPAEQWIPEGKDTEAGTTYDITELKVISHCCISSGDANKILKLLQKSTVEANTISLLNAAKNDEDAYAVNNGSILQDGDTMLTLS